MPGMNARVLFPRILNFARAACSAGLCAVLTMAVHANAAEVATPRQSSSTNESIRDYSNGKEGYANKSFTISGYPAGAKITKLVVEWGFVHSNHGDVVIGLSTQSNSRGNLDLFNRLNGSGSRSGGPTTSHHFDGEPVNQTYYLNAWDWAAGNTGYIDYFRLTIYFENSAPSLFSKSTPANGTGVTTYTVNFDWSSANDPDGDVVTYDLVVNDASGNSVAGCSAQGLSASQRTCTLPQQPNKNYYWQVWAKDPYNNVREASGGFWHLWTNTQPNQPPSSFSKSTPANGTGVTNYTVTLDWASASDPDGDTVTYDLVVNDANGNSVAGCSTQGLSASQRTCTLPQEPNKNYYWQVWAKDPYNNVRETSEGFWHLWTNTQPQMLWTKSVWTPNARITQLHGEFGTTFSGWTHAGVDVSDGTCGETPIYPVSSGTVEATYSDGVGDGTYLGNAIVIRHDGFYSLYAHMTSPSERGKDTPVKETDRLGFIDKTAAKTCHLHLEVRDFPQPRLKLEYEPPHCENIYRCGDARNAEYFLQRWRDPVSPRVGEFWFGSDFDSGKSALKFKPSTSVPGWDVSSNTYSSLFNDAYARHASRYKAYLGTPYDNGAGKFGGAYVHCWSVPGDDNCANGVWIQDLKRSQSEYRFWPDGLSSLILNPKEGKVFLLKEGFWNYYMNHDGFQNLGAPISDEEPFETGVRQRFENGDLIYHKECEGKPECPEDKTPPQSDLIEVRERGSGTVKSANNLWDLVSLSGEGVDIFQNGRYLCRTPCYRIYTVDGWRYTRTAPDATLVGAITSAAASTPSKAAGNPALHNEHDFSFTAEAGGGRVVLRTTSSDAKVRSTVASYYGTILRRAPESAGLEFWSGEAFRVVGLGANVSEVWYAIARTFFSSPEYVALNRDNAGFIADLYNTFFNRPPDASGLAYWTGQHAAGMPREVVLAGFIFSPEFTTFTQTIFGATAARAEVDAVMDFYRGLLARLPDDGGFGFWAGKFRVAQCSGSGAVLAEVESISSQFALSGEYATRNRSDAQYVGDLYNAFLRRGGDLAGVHFWINQLATKARTREQVRQAFVASPEFQGRVAAIIAQGCAAAEPEPIPMPVVSTVSPTSMSTGTSAQDLTISGSRFQRGNQVQFKRGVGDGANVWTNAPQAFTVNSSSQITGTFEPGTVEDTIYFRVCRSSSQTASSDCSSGKQAVKVVGTSTALFSDNFDRANSTDVGNGWTEESIRNNLSGLNAIDASSIADNRLRVAHQSNGFNVDAGIFRPLAEICGLEVSGTVEWMTLPATAATIALNRQLYADVAPANPWSYGFQFYFGPSMSGTGHIALWNEDTNLATTTYPFSVQQLYRYELRVNKDCSSEGRVWPASSTRPETPTIAYGQIAPVQRINPRLQIGTSGGLGCCTYPGYEVRFDDVTVKQLP